MQMDVLHQTIFGNARLLFNRKPLFFKSFSKNGLKRISDIWDYQNKTFLDSITIYNKLQNKRNWISEWSKIKTSVPKELVEKIKTLDIFTNKRKCKLYIDNNLFFCKNKIIQHKDVKLKTIQKLLNKTVEPKYQNKWELIHNKKTHVGSSLEKP